MSDKGVNRTAPATPDLLITVLTAGNRSEKVPESYKNKTTN